MDIRRARWQKVLLLTTSREKDERGLVWCTPYPHGLLNDMHKRSTNKSSPCPCP